MEIIRKKSSLYSFRCVRQFRWGTFFTEVGQVLEICEPQATAFVLSGRIEPVYPPELECVALADLTLPGSKEAFKCKRLERIVLRKKEALSFMLQKLCVPASDDVWRPFNMRLRKGPDRSRQERARMEKKITDNQLFAYGIHPSMTKK